MLEQVQGTRQQIEEQLRHLQSALEEETLAHKQQIQEWNLRFTAHQTALQQALTAHQERHDLLADQVEHTARETKRAISDLKHQGVQQHQDLEQLRTTLMGQFQETLMNQQEEQQALQRQLERIEQDVQQRSQNLLVSLKQQEEQAKETLTEITEDLTRFDAAQQEILLDVQNLQHTLSVQQQAWAAQVAELRGEVTQTLESELGRVKTAQNEYFGLLEQRLEATSPQEQQIQELRTLLQAEQAARLALSEQVATQHEHLQILRSELESLKSQRASTE